MVLIVAALATSAHGAVECRPTDAACDRDGEMGKPRDASDRPQPSPEKDEHPTGNPMDHEPGGDGAD